MSDNISHDSNPISEHVSLINDLIVRWNPINPYKITLNNLNNSDGNKLDIMFDKLQLKMIFPQKDTSNPIFFVLAQNNNDKIEESIQKINSYSFNQSKKKKPINVDKLFEKINKSYTKYNVSDFNTFTNYDFEIDKFDLEACRLKHTLQNNKATSVSQLTSVNINNTNNAGAKKNIYDSSLVGDMIIEEYVELYRSYKDNKSVELSIVNDNIYHWKLKFRKFSNVVIKNNLESLMQKYNYDFIEIDVHFHSQLYPNFPPFIKLIRPRLNNSLMNKLSNLKMIQFDYWTPTRSMKFIINKLHTILNKHVDINIDTEMNDITKYSDGAYTLLESYLIKLASYIDIVNTDTKELDETVYEKFTNDLVEVKSAQKPKVSSSGHWKKGTGYGHDGLKEWDINAYIKSQQEKDAQIQNILNKIIENIQNSKLDKNTLYGIIKDSYLVQFLITNLNGTNLLDISKRQTLYKNIFQLIQNLICEESIFLFDISYMATNLYKTIDDLNKTIKMSNKLVSNSTTVDTDHDDQDDNTINILTTLWEMIEPCYNIYIKTQTKTLTLIPKIGDSPASNSIHDKYREELEKLKFDSVNIISKQYYYKNQICGTLNVRYLKRIKNEYTSLISSLPIHYNSSIFVRTDENNLSALKIAITGPNNTPYDNGFFIFDVLIPNEYPIVCPKMVITNNAGRRFNPNLYADGKVCLSLLGTWRGTAAEGWNSTSTLNQLFLSTQSQIFIDEPYFNEPGHESSSNTSAGIAKSRHYNIRIRYFTMCHTIYDMLKNINQYPEFADAIKKHFVLKKDYIVSTCQKWVDEMDPMMLVGQYSDFDNNVYEKTSPQDNFKSLFQFKLNQIKNLIDAIKID